MFQYIGEGAKLYRNELSEFRQWVEELGLHIPGEELPGRLTDWDPWEPARNPRTLEERHYGPTRAMYFHLKGMAAALGLEREEICRAWLEAGLRVYGYDTAVF